MFGPPGIDFCVCYEIGIQVNFFSHLDNQLHQGHLFQHLSFSTNLRHTLCHTLRFIYMGPSLGSLFFSLVCLSITKPVSHYSLFYKSFMIA